MKIFLQIIVFFLIVSGIYAQTNYSVNSSTGNDIPGNGSAGSPWASIEYAVNHVVNPTTDIIIINVADGIYNLSNNPIDINLSFINLTILGTSTASTIVQAAATASPAINKRVFKIYASNTVLLKNMTIKNGAANYDGVVGDFRNGGGIFNISGNLTVENCLVTGNTVGSDTVGYGAGICNYKGTLKISNSTISNNGVLSFSNSTFYGGGVATLNGALTIENSTISYNAAPGAGGIGIFVNNDDSTPSNVIMTNSTVSENTAYVNFGGMRISRFSGTNAINVNINSCTIFKNSASDSYGGIGFASQPDSFYIKNSIVAGNTSSSGADNLRASTLISPICQITSGGYNIFQTDPKDITTNGAYSKSDPLLETLAINNSPNGTQTCATQVGSPAIDAITAVDTNGAPYLDQRGAGINPNTDIKDIGAYEWYLVHGMPVELTSFTSQLKNNKVILKWITATEVNNYGFDVERNTPLNPLSRGEAEGRGVWEKIGFVNGNGTSNSPKNYSYEDKTVTASKYSYRLKQIDNDGQYEYSSTIEVDLGLPDKFELSQNYPNPFNPSTKISWQSPVDSWQTLKVYDVLGNEVTTLINEYKPAGSYEVEFNVAQESFPAITSGVYFYRLQVGSFVQTRKMILMK